MADEKIEEKTKQTVPGMERTAKGVAAHAQAVQDMQWDKDRKVFRDPVISMLALFTYAKVTPALLAKAEQKIEALEKRIAEFETRIAAVEKWKVEAEAQTMEMVKNAEEMLAGGPEAFIEKMRASMPPTPLSVVKDAEVVEKKERRKEKPEANGEKKGDVA